LCRNREERPQLAVTGATRLGREKDRGKEGGREKRKKENEEGRGAWGWAV
jgi:hypothetical protein